MQGKDKRMKKVIEFAGLSDEGVVEFGKVIFENGKLEIKGSDLLKRMLKNKVRDLRPGKNQEWVGQSDPELFLKCLPYYYCGSRFCAGRVNEKRRKGEKGCLTF